MAAKPAPPQIDPLAKPKMRDAYKQLTSWVLEDIAPLYADAGLDFSSSDAVACVGNLFEQACIAGKVE